MDLHFRQIGEAGVSGNGKIVEEIVGKIYSCVVYNVSGHARHISEGVVTKISETHNILIKQLVKHDHSSWIYIVTRKSLPLHHQSQKPYPHILNYCFTSAKAFSLFLQNNWSFVQCTSLNLDVGHHY